MPHTLYQKLDWRFRFLLGDTPQVLKGMLGANPFSVPERLAFINPFRRRLGREDLLRHALRRRGGPDDYFLLDGFRIYFRPDFPMGDDEELLSGTVQILQEAFLFPDHFSEHVGIAPGDFVLDLGGNLGTSALCYSRAVGPEGQVFSFEPVTPQLIVRNIAANGIRNVTVVPCAVGEEAGEAEFTCGAGLLDSSMARLPRKPVRTFMVRVCSIDDYVEQERLQRVDFIKMDIEGAEELALRGARRVIERFRPKWSIASYHTDHVGEKQHPKLVRLLREYGYDRVDEVDGKRIFAY